MKIGIVKESNSYHDHRVPLTPLHARQLMDQFPSLQIKIQPSPSRCFNDKQYREEQIEVSNDLSDCDILLGIKAIGPEELIPGKTYLFFAHVAKQQQGRGAYLRQLAANEITLIDYEYLRNDKGKRISAFGYWAGIVGTYYAFQALGLRSGQFQLPMAKQTGNYLSMINEIAALRLRPIKILISGRGLSSSGVVETLKMCGIREVEPLQFTNDTFDSPVFCRLKHQHYLVHNEKPLFDKTHFKKNPQEFHSIFAHYARAADVYIAAHYWQQGAPPYLTIEDLQAENQHLKIIADISCDLKGPIASTIRESTHEAPFYDFDSQSASEKPPFSSDKHLTVMAIGNLPDALPRDASYAFSMALKKSVIPELLAKEPSAIIQRGTLLKNGKLSPQFSYLYNYLNTDN